MAIQKLTTSIDYTSRDFFSLRQDLISRVKTRVNTAGKVWNGTDPADFGVAIIEAFAHMGDLTNYYIDRVANEAYLSTATQRRSLINLANMYGYRPAGYRQATVDITLVNPNDYDVVVPEGTLLSVTIVLTTNGSSTTYQEYFTLIEDVTIGALGASSGQVVHGRNASSIEANAATPGDEYDIPGERLAYSTGLANQSYTLKFDRVVDNSVRVFVRNADSFVEWAEVPNLTEYGPQDFIYSLSYSGNNFVTVNFGDGVSGAIPVYGDDIKVQYFIGGGLVGNIDSGVSFSIVSVPVSSGIELSSLTAITISSSDVGYGGEEPESNESIRLNAPNALRSSQRSVSLDDFKSFALSTPGVGKAAAYAAAPTSVNLYVSPTVSDTSADYYPGFAGDGTTLKSSWTNLRDDISGELSNKTQIGTTVTILPPIYVDVDTVVEYVSELSLIHI